MREGFDQNKWLEHGVWNPRADGPVAAMKGQSCPVRVQRSRINLNDRGAEDSNVVLVGRITKMPKESIKGSADIGPVADSNDTLIAEPKLPSACVQPNIIMVKFEVPLAQVKDVAHIPCDTAHWQP